MLHHLRHIASPMLTLLLSLYAASLLVCVDCLRMRDTDCTAPLNQLLYKTLLREEIASTVSSQKKLPENSSIIIIQAASTLPFAAHTAAKTSDHDHNTHPCLSHIPALVETASFNMITQETALFLPHAPARVPLHSRQVLYRPPIA
ncbi:MAG: hypothetical protein MUF71_10865 [Candidatus Kapabacteria bacterium]|jgi:hypothetical protein|nr:hypothetical protein [Candidatus Kapabacteria bacterium]